MIQVFLAGKCKEFMQVRSILQSIRLPPVRVINSRRATEIELSINAQGEVILQQQKFKPKFGPLEVKNGCIQYSAVVITHVVHPYHIYVQFEDQELPLYRKMMKDLQIEFRDATNESPTYCPSPVEGTLLLR